MLWINLGGGKTVRKDAVLPDGTVVIIKPQTPSGVKSALKKRKTNAGSWI